MPVVAVDDVDLGLVRVEAAPQPVRGHRAARSAAEDHDLLLAHDAPPVAASARRDARGARWSRRTRCRPRSSGEADTSAATFSRRSQLRVAEVAAELDRDLEPARGRAVVVVDLDRRLRRAPSPSSAHTSRASSRRRRRARRGTARAAPARSRHRRGARGSSVIRRCWPSITTSCRSVPGIERAVAVRLMVSYTAWPCRATARHRGARGTVCGQVRTSRSRLKSAGHRAGRSALSSSSGRSS